MTQRDKVHVERSGLCCEGVAPDCIEDLGAADGDPDVLSQKSEEVELGPGERKLGAADGDAARGDLNRDVPHPQQPSILGYGSRVSGNHLDARDQFAQPHRLNQVVVSTQPEAQHGRPFVPARGHHDDGGVAELTHLPDHGKPVFIFETQVEQDNLGLAVAQQGIGSAGDVDHPMTVARQLIAQRLRQGTVVLNDEKVHDPRLGTLVKEVTGNAQLEWIFALRECKDSGFGGGTLETGASVPPMNSNDAVNAPRPPAGSDHDGREPDETGAPTAAGGEGSHGEGSRGEGSGGLGITTALRDTPTTTNVTLPEDLISEYDEELPSRSLPQRFERVVIAYCFVVAAFVLYQVFFPLRQGNQFSLVAFLSATLPLTFLLYRGRTRRTVAARDVPGWFDISLTVVAAIVCTYPMLPLVIGDGGGGFDAFLNRQGSLATTDIIAGALLTILVLEAARRTTGIVLPAFCVAFFLFAYYGGYLPMNWAISHGGVNFSQIINGFYNDQSGFFGTPLNVAATYIVLFIFYGQVLAATGAGRFFVTFSFSLFHKSRSAAGRTVVTSGFLLGTVSGSGTATAVTLGSLAWPILKRAGYPRENAAGMLAAAGIGAILSPPTLGAAAFIIAEYLGVAYLEVMIWAIIPTILYYAGIFVAVEIDARRFSTRPVAPSQIRPVDLLKRFGYHFLSLAIIVVFLAMGLPPFRSIVYATAVAALFGLIERLVSRRDPLDEDSVPQLIPAALAAYAKSLYGALANGVRASIPVVAVCAAAGIITSVIVKTGVGLTFAQMLVAAAQAVSSNPQIVLIVTALLAAVAITLLGLAVPVTASFIISWVIIGPALITLGVERPEVAMFIFYYAVLSEVSPPTALAAVAAAALTGAATMKSMWQAMKYALPAFLAPLAFVLTPAGGSLLLNGDWVTSIWATAVSLFAVAALAAATGGWAFGRALWPERWLFVIGAVFCLYLEPVSIGIGIVTVAVAACLNYVRVRRNPEHSRGVPAPAIPR